MWAPEPRILVDVKTRTGRFQKVRFLLDTGAAVSAIHVELVDLLGISFHRRRRMDFSGVGADHVQAYLNEVTIRLCDRECSLPVLIYESEQLTESFLGRAGFYEHFSIALTGSQLTITAV